jgi:beta-glucosidase
VGDVSGSEVVQLYIRDVEASVDRPLKELKGFNKIHLDAGESKLVSFAINELDLAFFDPGQEKWVTEHGEFELQIGNSSKEIKIQKTIYLIE